MTNQHANTYRPARFLESVAAYLADHPQWAMGLTVVFPNKRSAIFFRRYYKQHCRRKALQSALMPHITTIGAFETSVYAPKTNSDSRLELVMLLYKAYCETVARHRQEPMPFDRFAYWGEIILDDFEDIDRSLADAQNVYTNLRRFQEIQANFLTPRQKDLIRQLWGEDYGSVYMEETDNFWLHIDKAADGDKPSAQRARRFRKLWEVMGDVYAAYRRVLDEKGMSYPALTERRVTECLCQMGAGELPFERIAFVGFNQLSLAQCAMLKHLQKTGVALFFWDILPDDPYSEAANRQLKRLNAMFPMPPDFTPPPMRRPQVTVMGVPSSVLQTKVCGNILSDWLADGRIIDSRFADNTAIIVPDTRLLPSLLHSLPDNLGQVNLTMGLSFRGTPFAAMMRAMVSMHMRRRRVDDAVSFYYEDISSLVTDQQLRAVAPEACDKIKDFIDRRRLYMLPVDTILHEAEGTPLAAFFRDVDADNPDSVRDYITEVLRSVRGALEGLGPINAEAHEVKVLEAYEESVAEIFTLMQRHNIMYIGEGTLFNMVERLLAARQINMSGTPLAGVQMMGVLETRALDFDNVIVLSMNERMFPRRQRMRTLIPQQLRAAYGLPTADREENEYAYYFYRMLSRSRRVLCLYDARAKGLASGAMSRFLMQMRHLPGRLAPKFGYFGVDAESEGERKIEVVKDKRVMELLRRFKIKVTDDDADKARNLSASHLKKYLKCPLMFYLECVEGVHSDNPPVPYMDAATFGNVIHHVMQQLYEHEAKGAPLEVTEKVLRRMLGADIYALVLTEINREYYRDAYKGRIERMPGEGLLLAEQMVKYIRKVLETEIDFARKNDGFTFIGAEVKLNSLDKLKPAPQWQVNDHLAVNVRMDIDRFDQLNDNELRFVDYKTGSDSNVVTSIEGLFDQERKDSNDAAFQLLFYAELYTALTGRKCRVRPALYRLQVAFKEKSDFADFGLKLKGEKREVVWHNTGDDGPNEATEFRTRLVDMVEDIFDESLTFAQSPSYRPCKYCAYVDMCKRGHAKYQPSWK